MYAENKSIITLRSGWQSDGQVFAGLKGSGANMEHKHLNMGTFAFYANGVKWTTDIGYDNYNLPGFFDDISYSGNRWKYYRQRAEAHNCLVIDPGETPDMAPYAQATIIKKSPGIIFIKEIPPELPFGAVLRVDFIYTALYISGDYDLNTVQIQIF